MHHLNLREEILEKSPRFAGHLIDVDHWRVRLPNGQEANREIVVHRGAAAVVPVDDRGFVTLVRQGRPATDSVLLEIPAGKVDALGEDPLVCARRELREETGYTAQTWRHLTTIWTTPGFCTERIALYLATDLTQGEAQPDADEFLALVRMPLSEAVASVMRGELTDAKSIAGLLMASQALLHQTTI